MLEVIIGLGANLGDPPAVFAGGLRDLADHCTVAAVSRLWRTRPVGPEQPDFINAAAFLRWPGDPRRLLAECHRIEAAAGRNRRVDHRWGPRTLDLDLLMVRNLVFRSRGLDLPHPRFHERAFALVPAAEIAVDWAHPLLGRTIGELAEEARAADPDALISSESFPR